MSAFDAVATSKHANKLFLGMIGTLTEQMGDLETQEIAVLVACEAVADLSRRAAHANKKRNWQQTQNLIDRSREAASLLVGGYIKPSAPKGTSR